MKLTDIELASLIDALRHVDGNRFEMEQHERGHSWYFTATGLLSHKVIEK